ncbi:Tryptophan synthase alpha chain [Dissostichus eleginoides]|uniref:Tryptophan synthase alpha chain n=1 Tax=Dissostichus eleginoides TaxID=100907 RepID=A0AAD9C8V3_DISEL|nr:Tryptophan synthase alpha chain [Dissostichus eleginoides]
MFTEDGMRICKAKSTLKKSLQVEVSRRNAESDVYLIFDRYYDYSIKSVTRDVRETVVSRKHHLLLSTKLPAQKVVLSSIENKKQLNRFIFKELTEDRLFHLRGTNKHKLGGDR